jgi:prepilin-type N-terminal cleavage/methylation domain-containing protein
MTSKTTHPNATPTSSRRDHGFTLVELVISVSLVGLITTVLAAAIVVSLRTIPDTENRLDDARATRALATWLSHDTTSAPRFLPEQAQGGINLANTVTADNNDCGGEGTNLLHLQWTEDSFVDTTHVANYRFVIDGGEGQIRRYACSAVGTGSFSSSAGRILTSGLDPTQLPVIVPEPATGEVAALTFQLVGKAGEIVAIETGSRNPADFFPS